MNRIVGVLLAILLVPMALEAQGAPPGCSWEGDPAIRFGWGSVYAGWMGYAPPPGMYHGHGAGGDAGMDTTWGLPGQTLAFRLGPLNASPSWLPSGCKAADTFCFDVSSDAGWSIACDWVAGIPIELYPGYLWTQKVNITIPCSAAVGSYYRIIATMAYWMSDADTCAPWCGDCNDPNIRPTDGFKYYSRDTLWVRVDPPPSFLPPTILQDTLDFVMRGQTMAYLTIGLCNNDQCFDMNVGYHIASRGHIGPPISTYDTVLARSGKCVDVYGILNAGTAPTCTYDTLEIVAWSCAAIPAYDTCVMRVHVIDMCCGVPLDTAPTAALVAAVFIIAAGAFLYRRRKRPAPAVRTGGPRA